MRIHRIYLANLETSHCVLFYIDFMDYALLRYPWGEEAFQKAKRENKPIFLSGRII